MHFSTTKWLPHILKRKSPHEEKVGLAPGSLVFTGKKKVEDTTVTTLVYNVEQATEIAFERDAIALPGENEVIWHDIRGLHDIELIKEFGHAFHIHSLTLEDIVDVYQRPKFEEFANGIFVVVKNFKFQDDSHILDEEQIAIYCLKDAILSFQEQSKDIFPGVRKRILAAHSKLRQRGSDYLIYALIDHIVDNYYLILDAIETSIDHVEEEVLHNPSTNTKGKIHVLKRMLTQLRKAVSPLREAINRFSKSEHELIASSTPLYLRDLYDHTIHVMDMIETYRDTLSSLHDLYISELSFKMNSVMQVLTIIATIFIPLTFLAGIYGMNFTFMPELGYKYSYFVVLGIMVLIGIGLLIYFKRKNWL